MAEAARQSMSKAHYLAKGLCSITGVARRFDENFFHEFLLDMPKIPEILETLEKNNILGGLPVDGGILWCVTEKVPRETLDKVISIVKEVLGK